MSNNFGQSRGHAWPIKIFHLSTLITVQNLVTFSTLITVQNLVTFSHTVCMIVGVSKNFGDLGALLLRMRAWLTPRKAPVPTRYHTKFGHSRLNHMGIRGGPKNFRTLGLCPMIWGMWLTPWKHAPPPHYHVTMLLKVKPVVVGRGCKNWGTMRSATPHRMGAWLIP